MRLLHPGSVLIKAAAENAQLAPPRRRIAGRNSIDWLNACDLDAFVRKKCWCFSFRADD